MPFKLGWVVAFALLGSMACSGDPIGEPATPGGQSPSQLTATPLGQHLVRLTWSPVAGSTGYRIERRSNLSGAFSALEDVNPGTAGAYTDNAVDPGTIYGYRLRSLSQNGTFSSPSLIVGVLTPPVQGLMVTTQVLTPEVTDSDGYEIRVVSPAGDTLRSPFAAEDERLFVPLDPGSYTVQLTGLALNCTTDDMEHTAVVTDQGLSTRDTVGFPVSCRAPDRGRLRVEIQTTGDSLDADGYHLAVSGIASDASLPDSLRAYLRTSDVTVNPIPQTYDNLRVGSYSVVLTGVAGNCTLAGAKQRDLDIAALEDDTVSYKVSCTGTPDDPNRPLAWRSAWSNPAPGAGDQVSLDVELDLSARSTEDVAAVQATLRFDPSVVRFDSAAKVDPWQVTANPTAPGTVDWLAFVTGLVGEKGVTTFARFYFTVIGEAGASTKTATTIAVAANGNGDDLTSLIRRVEATLTVGDTGPTNAPPVADAGGPYSGVAGVPVTLDGTASSDPDGTIVSYAWIFGDGGTGSGATPTHSYSAPGSYPVSLTVTDNDGATAITTATVAVTTGAGNNQPPVAMPGGPYSGVTGTAVAFNGSTSTDADGTIASYAWVFGDGSTGTGATPSHSYLAPGSYIASLTVTDDQGATNSASTSVTVTDPGGGSQPFLWQNSFGSVNPADSVVALTITLDLSADIPQTPGAEALQSWSVDSLIWDPTKLQYFAFNFGPGGSGSVDPTDAVDGKLTFGGTQPAAQSTGVISIATVRFKVIAVAGAHAATTTALGLLLGTAATGPFSYTALTRVREASVVAP